MNILVTGANGLVGSEIVRWLPKKGNKIILLLHNKYGSTTKKEQLKADITKPFLGLGKKIYKSLSKEIDIVYHSAALYDTSANISDLNMVNVIGTKNILKFCKNGKNKQLNYISTLFVSGCFEGRFPENKLPKVNVFHNYYEKSKYFAEKIVRKSGLKKCNIYRLPIIVGDSKLGATSKFDGIYKLIALIYSKMLFFYPGKCEGFAYILPVDEVAHFIAMNGLKRIGRIKTYNMSPKNNLTYKEFINFTKFIFGIKNKYINIPQFVVDVLPLGLIRIFNQNIHYENKNYLKSILAMKYSQQDIKSWLPNVLKYYVKNKHLS